jgi:IS5 family transposase
MSQKYIDNRNWSEYNEKLVKRGELYLDLKFLRKWDSEIRMMNNCKRGRPYLYTKTFIQFMALIHIIFYLPYRQMEGFLRKLSEYIQKLNAPDYSTLHKRMKMLELTMIMEKTKDYEPVVIAIDSSGIKVTNRGEWIREIWKKRRGWIKVHIAVDVKKKRVVGLEVTDERISDHEKFDDLLGDAENNLGKGKIKLVLADGNYDTKDNFNSLKARGIEAGIKTRINASTRARGSSYRAEYIREFRRLGYDKWRDKYRYGSRWSVEGVFSAVKRIMGESVRASSIEGMFREVKMKFIFYNLLLTV